MKYKLILLALILAGSVFTTSAQTWETKDGVQHEVGAVITDTMSRADIDQIQRFLRENNIHLRLVKFEEGPNGTIQEIAMEVDFRCGRAGSFSSDEFDQVMIKSAYKVNPCLGKSVISGKMPEETK
jgi:hypothetical protein